ncbi:hypothetical protein C8R45DRAFT_1093024 [Mycena sanguinolenta]|nr:hypothetical protein C8R45DRAFT_1093024 [Mycena sanguinolenta]
MVSFITGARPLFLVPLPTLLRNRMASIYATLIVYFLVFSGLVHSRAVERALAAAPHVTSSPSLPCSPVRLLSNSADDAATLLRPPLLSTVACTGQRAPPPYVHLCLLSYSLDSSFALTDFDTIRRPLYTALCASAPPHPPPRHQVPRRPASPPCASSAHPTMVGARGCGMRLSAGAAAASASVSGSGSAAALLELVQATLGGVGGGRSASAPSSWVSPYFGGLLRPRAPRAPRSDFGTAALAGGGVGSSDVLDSARRYRLLSSSSGDEVLLLEAGSALPGEGTGVLWSPMVCLGCVRRCGRCRYQYECRCWLWRKYDHGHERPLHQRHDHERDSRCGRRGSLHREPPRDTHRGERWRTDAVDCGRVGTASVIMSRANMVSMAATKYAGEGAGTSGGGSGQATGRDVAGPRDEEGMDEDENGDDEEE